MQVKRLALLETTVQSFYLLVAHEELHVACGHCTLVGRNLDCGDAGAGYTNVPVRVLADIAKL